MQRRDKKRLRDGSFLRASTQTQRTVLGMLWVSMHVRCCCSFRGVTIDLLLPDCCFFYPDLCSLGGPSPNSKPSTSVVTDSGSSLFKQTKSFSPEHFVCCQMDRKECKIVLKCASKGQRSLVRQCGAPLMEVKTQLAAWVQKEFNSILVWGSRNDGSFSLGQHQLDLWPTF